MARQKSTTDVAPLYLGMEIGGTKLQIVIGPATGQIIDRRRFVIDPAEGAKGILAQIGSGLDSLLARHTPAAIGVGYGGPVDWRSGRIWRSYHIEGWSDFPLAKWLGERTRLPVFVDNDGNVAALGEAHHGAGGGCDSVVYVTLGSGVGAGLVIDGAIYHGQVPGELELGHVRLNEAGLIVQERCSGWAVDAIVREAVRTSPDSILARICTKTAAAKAGGEARHLAAAISQKCAVAQVILDGTMRQLALALSHGVHLVHPQIIIIGGGLSLLGEPLRHSLATQLPEFLMDAFQPGPTIALAALAEDAVPIGAITLAAMRSCGAKTGGPAPSLRPDR